jgi:hypothetical protein
VGLLLLLGMLSVVETLTETHEVAALLMRAAA